ncbi:MAG: hypothetical protein ACRC4L_03190 [Mycoplasma sp.]
MSFIKKVFKSTFGIAGVALSVAGLGLTVAGAVMVPTSANSKASKDVGWGETVKIGNGTSNWGVIYKDNDKFLMDMEEGDLVKVTSNKQIKDFHKKTIDSFNEDSALKMFKYKEKELEKLISDYQKMLDLLPDGPFKDEVIASLNYAEQSLKDTKEIISNFNVNAWGIALVVVGPVALIAGSSLSYFGFKKSKKEDN